MKIAILTDNPIDFVVSFLSALKLGGAIVPIDPYTPIARLKYILSSSGATAILTSSHIAESLNEALRDECISTNVICVDDISVSSDITFSSISIYDSVELDDDAYVIFTSGTTGNPKGVAITHRNLYPLLDWLETEFALGGDTVLQHILSFAFDFGLKEILSTIFFGGQLVVENRSTDPVALAQSIKRNNVNLLYTTPSYLTFLLGNGPFPSLNTVCVGGEAFTYEISRQLRGVCSRDCRIYNGYGPSEATINCAMHLLGSSSHKESKTVPIGRSSGLAELYICDSNGEIVQTGIPGELLIGGPSVSAGYVNSSDETKKRFLILPKLSNGHVYKTGDLVRQLNDDVLEYLGRMDTQFKHRGYRIETAEIEYVLEELDTISAVAVRHWENKSGQSDIVAYITPQNGMELDLVKTKDYLSTKLPNYMLPTRYSIVERLPLNQNGKIDYQKLSEPTEMKALAPQNIQSLALKIAIFWRENLNKPTFNINDDYFHHGANSLMVLNVHEKISDTISIKVPIAYFYQYTTPQKLANALMDRDHADNDDALPMADFVEAGTKASNRNALIEKRKKRSIPEKLHYE